MLNLIKKIAEIMMGVSNQLRCISHEQSNKPAMLRSCFKNSFYIVSQIRR